MRRAVHVCFDLEVDVERLVESEQLVSPVTAAILGWRHQLDADCVSMRISGNFRFPTYLFVDNHKEKRIFGLGDILNPSPSPGIKDVSHWMAQLLYVKSHSSVSMLLCASKF